eukprot:7121525-Prymnesium_polylepis.3
MLDEANCSARHSCQEQLVVDLGHHHSVAGAARRRLGGRGHLCACVMLLLPRLLRLQSRCCAQRLGCASCQLARVHCTGTGLLRQESRDEADFGSG